MDCKYVLVRDTYLDDTGPHIGYGIAVFDSEHITISVALDISSNETDVADIVQMCNRLNLSPIHFQDVIEDFLR